MENLMFVIWMILFPFCNTVANVIRHKYGQEVEYSDLSVALSALVYLVVWVCVGDALYHG